jgi:transcriptional regulator with XRE-family HTH domain
MIEWPIDWRDVLDEARNRRNDEGLSQRALAELAGVSAPTVNAFEQGEIKINFASVVAILDALGMFVKPGPPDSLNTFTHAARRRWAELVAGLPADHPSRQPQGHSEQAYALEGVAPVSTLGKLRDLLSHAPGTSGWTPFWVPTREGIRPSIQDRVVECWLGRPESDRAFNDPAHSDFWQVARDGTAYLQRGYQEDGNDLDPGTIFDLTLPIWRTGEVLLHAAWLARQLGADESDGIRFRARYTGLEGRELQAWAKRQFGTLDDRHRSRTSAVDLIGKPTVGAIENNLPEVVHDILVPLYERFDGFDLTYRLVSEQIDELRRAAR